MKIASSFLYDLVHTLTKSEKRYIKVQSGIGEKDYLLLFDALLAQKSFDENQLIKDHIDARFIKHLAVNKQYLYELLLKSLRRFNQKSLENKVIEKLDAANVLIEKGLFKAAERELQKGHKIANKYEFFELQIMLNSLQKKLLAQRQFKSKDDNAIHQIFKTETNCLEQLKNTNEYWYLSQQIVQFQMRFQKIQTEEQKEYIKNLSQSPKFHNSDLATNFKSKLYFYQINSTYQFMLGNVEKAYEINSQFLDFLDKQPHFLVLYAERYLATLNNMLIDSLVIGKYEMLDEGINRLAMTLERKEFKSIKNIESRVFRQRYLLLINWSLSQHDFTKAMDWIPEIETGLAQFDKKIEKHHRITFYYLVAYLLFLNKRFEDAIKWNNYILNETKEDVVKEIFHFARILNLLIHFELGNHDLLDSLLLSTPKYLKSRRTIYETEKALFRFLRKSLNVIDKMEKRKLISDFREEIERLKADFLQTHFVN